MLSGGCAGQAWILEAGDALYLPPRLAHHGVSMDEVGCVVIVVVGGDTVDGAAGLTVARLPLLGPIAASSHLYSCSTLIFILYSRQAHSVDLNDAAQR